MKVIIFDFDGTIADSFDAVLTICNRLALEFGYPVTHPEDVKQLRNLSSREILQRSGVSVFKLPFLLRRLRVELNREIGQLKPFPGIREALIGLKKNGYYVGIVTSNSRENVVDFLRTQKMEEVFDFVDSGLTLFGKGGIIKRILRQQNIPLEAAIYVGDEIRDIEAARRIGIKAIAVSWGFNSKQALIAQDPDSLIEQPDELVEAVERLVLSAEC